jgi:hypothetical protein
MPAGIVAAIGIAGIVAVFIAVGIAVILDV